MTQAWGPSQGMALLEALVASAILGIGLVGAMQLSLKTLNTTSENRQHTVAQQLAQEAMSCLHTQAKSATLVCPTEESLEVQGVRYTLQTRRTARGDGQLNDLLVRVQWRTSGRPEPAQIEWHSSASALPSWLGVSSP